MAKTEKKLEFNIFEHELVPKHFKLSQKEVEELLVKHHIKAYHLPSIKIADPAVKAIPDVKVGDVIKIVRKGFTVAYRYVV